MSKKVLILSGSPRRKGNSDLLCDEFARGAMESGNSVEKIILGTKKINFCLACDSCRKTGVCAQKDDMKEILDKMLAADVIVMATPVYFYSINGQMKTCIDRTVPQYMNISNKKFYFIITAWDPEKAHFERTVECFRGFTECLDGAVEKGIVYGLGVEKKGDVKTTPAMKQAYDYGKGV